MLTREHLMAAAEHQRELPMLLAQRAQLGRGSCEETVAIQREILEIYSEVAAGRRPAISAGAS
ncbi:hypothetical protein [Shinella pollutisoli]|uniref:Uncharacterized protein n=1 Tax=Shinella pollutisoli TaxID=2250594 RepID=A0ABV7DLV4_9HYPH|nr:hypothetical protein [Shinella pollutisoli]